MAAMFGYRKTVILQQHGAPLTTFLTRTGCSRLLSSPCSCSL